MNKVENAFDKAAQKYDSQRRNLIPCFDDFYGTIVKLANITSISPQILDIGAGTGLLSELMLNKYPQSFLTLVDLSEEMLNIGRIRFTGNNRIKYLKIDYQELLETSMYEIVVSALSIHHLENPQKKALFEKIYKMLKTNGLFINGDQFLGRVKDSEEHYQKAWIEKIESTNLSKDEKDAAYSRMKLDKPATVDDNIKWLEEVGFVDVEIYYKYYNFGVLMGRKL